MEQEYYKPRGWKYEVKSFLNTFAASFLSVFGTMFLLVDPFIIDTAELSAASAISAVVALVRMLITSAIIALQNTIKGKNKG